MTDQFGEIGTEAIRLLCGERRRVDISDIRRSLIEAMQAWPGSVDEQWWKWLVESGRGLSFATRVIDASPLEVFELLRHGVEAVTLCEDSCHPMRERGTAASDSNRLNHATSAPSPASAPNPARLADASGYNTESETSAFRLMVLTGSRRSKFRLCELPNDPAGRWVSQRELSRVLGGTKATTSRRWVILDPMSDDMPLAGHGHAPHGIPGGRRHDDHPSPWRRLREFLRPEYSDIWIVFVFAVVTGMLTLATPIAVEALVNTVAFGTLMQPLIVLSLILLICLSFAASLRFLQRFVVELIQRRLFARVAARLAWQLPRIRMDQTQELTPELVNRFFDVITMQKIVAQLLLDGLTVVLTVLLGMVVLAFYHPWLLAFDATLLIIVSINVFLLSRGAVRTSIVESQCKYSVAGWLEDMTRCPTTFKAGGAAEYAITRANRLTTDYLMARENHYRVVARQLVAGLLLEALASAVLLGLGGFLVIQGQMTLGQLVAAELIVTLIVASVAKLDKQFEGFYDLLTSMDKLGHVFDLPVEPSSGVMHVGRTGAAAVSLRHVAVTHDDGSVGLSEISLDVAPGEIIAIAGPAGCGKSTLLDLLFRLREPSSGRIVLDDHDLTDLRPDVLRQNVALARGIEILEGTLAENVHLDRPDISTADVRTVLKRVGLDDSSSFAESPVGLDQHLAHNGAPLSESQARRLMLARALAGKPRLLLIDGLLDSFADDDAARLMNELKEACTACSILIATSRRNIVESCDRICLL